MISAVVAGNLGKDAEVKQLGGQTVCNFSVASSSKVKGEETTTWVSCALWGKRGESLADYLTKGKSVCVSGGLTTREHNGKTYLEMRVDDVKLMGGGKEQATETRPREKAAPALPKTSNGYSDADYGGGDDDIPF
jgi:single-strand DNA-binding protein